MPGVKTSVYGGDITSIGSSSTSLLYPSTITNIPVLSQSQAYRGRAAETSPDWQKPGVFRIIFPITISLAEFVVINFVAFDENLTTVHGSYMRDSTFVLKCSGKPILNSAISTTGLYVSIPGKQIVDLRSCIRLWMLRKSTNRILLWRQYL